MSEYDKEFQSGTEEYEEAMRGSAVVDECVQFVADFAETAREFVRRNPALLFGVAVAIAAGVMLLGSSRRRAVE